MSAARKKSQKPGLELIAAELRDENQKLSEQLRENERIQKIREERREREYRMKYLSFINCIADPVFIYDAITYKFLHCNEAAIDNYGYNKEEILTMTPFDLHRQEEFEKVRANIDKRIVRWGNTYTHITKDRRERIVEITASEIYFDGKPAWMSVVHDITDRELMEEELQKYRFQLEEMVNERTIEVLLANKQLKQEVLERKKAELAILESEKKMRNIIEKSRDGIILVDENGSIIQWNSGQETIYGTKRAMVVGKKIWDVQFQHEPKTQRDEENHKKIENIWVDFYKTGVNPFKNDLHVSMIERPDGNLRDIQQMYFTIETDNGVMMACTTRDITEKLLMEKQLTQSQKMEAMGTLAGGIAHDFNNLLGGIIGYTDLAIRKADKDSPLQKYLGQVLTASRRATDLVKQILTFSRSEDKEKKEPVQLSLIVKEALKLLRSTLPVNIEVISRIEAKDCFILANPTQFHQVIMNLCTNAIHAMKDNGGIMEVKLIEETIEDPVYKGIKPGPHLRLTVSDTGCGVKQEFLDKIFDPFFTTKKPGEGTGMGLAVVHGIVEGHSGHITVFSKEGQGTAFSILVPIIVDVIHKQETEEKDIPRGDERILLVEDDAYLAEAEKKMLEELGYKVTALTSSVEAFEIFQKLSDRFDIIITDYAIPKMTGVQLIRKVRSINSDIPVIICTGFSKEVQQQKIGSLGIGEIIMKPIELGYIANAIRRLLEKK
jgi:two-component system, cell cycle sensor histidine kinase and response regulator CckA